MSQSLKIIIIAGIVWVAASASYYFVYYLPKQENEARIFATNQKCFEVGKVLYDKYSEDKKNMWTVPPRYGYNQRLNTCIYSTGYKGAFTDEEGVDHSVTLYFVMDSYSGEEIIFSGTDNGKETFDLSKEQFDEQSYELFK
jgi:hypothetical protein